METMIHKKLFALCCAIVVGVICVYNIVNWAWLKPKKLERFLRKQGLDGTSYRLLIGDLKESSFMTKSALSKPINLDDNIIPRLLPFIHKSVSIYGKSSFTWFGPTPRVTIMDPELIKDVLSKITNYQKPKLINPLMRLLAVGLANHEGDQWAKHRKIISPAFHIQQLKLMEPAFCLSTHETISQWEEKTAKTGSCELDVWPYLEILTSDAISRTAFGSNYEQGKRIFQLQKQQGELVIQAVQSLYIPGWRFLPTKRNKQMKAIDKEVQASLRQIISGRIKVIESAEATQEDLLSIMLESNMKQIKHNANISKKVGMSIDDIIGECKLFYVAGQETTSSLLTWTMILLSVHQDWQQHARDEVYQVFENSKPNFDGLNRLKIVNMILHEVLRLYPPISTLGRSVPKDIKLGEMSIPAGTMIHLPMLLLHRSKELWGEDANEFKPQRFLQGVSMATNNQLSYFPFGWGPRLCIGQQFAMVETKIAISMILQRFAFEISPSYIHAPITVINIQPQYGAHLILHKL